MADPNQPTELSRKFVAAFGAEYANILTPSEMVDVCIKWAKAWHATRTRNIITLVRDYPDNKAWVGNDYITEGYSTLVEEFNTVVHSRGVPALSALFEDLYFISEKDLFDMYRYTKETSEVTGRQSEGSKLFSYMANYLEEYFGWRGGHLLRLDTLMRVAVEKMTGAVRERRERGPGPGPGGIQVPWHWNQLLPALRHVNQEVTDITVKHDLSRLIRQIRRGTIMKVQHTSSGFPTRPEVVMQQVPDMPSLMGTAGPPSASGSGTQAVPPPTGNVQPPPQPTASASNQKTSTYGSGGGKKIFKAFGAKKKSESTAGPSGTQAGPSGTQAGPSGTQAGPSGTQARPSGTQATSGNQNTAKTKQGGGGYSASKGSWRKNDNTQNPPNSGKFGSAKQPFPWKKRDDGNGGGNGKHDRWWDDSDSEPRDNEATSAKKRKTSGF
ncbi:hypothetical protein PG991_014893 [Apiospora marii]|uniref:Uncharacterized protein n=1 Tax=Apiospora marii TaxID=335849 RepID=A0ABR1R553_9PEZI